MIGRKDNKITKIIIDPSLGGSKIKYKMSRFNLSKMLESFIGKLGWLIVVIAALALSFWSLYFVATYYGLPQPLAIIVSTAFDGAAIVCADLTLKYARSYGDSGLAPRMAVFLLAGASAYLNSQHAILNHDGKPAIILYACPPIIAVLLFELHSRYERRNALRKAGRVAKSLPVFGRWAWILFPIKSFKMMRGIVARRMAQHEMAENEQIITTNVMVMTEARQVRAWALQRGLNIGSKGRIPGEIVQAFQAEQLEIEAKKEPNLTIIPDNKSIQVSNEDHSEERRA